MSSLSDFQAPGKPCGLSAFALRPLGSSLALAALACGPGVQAQTATLPDVQVTAPEVPYKADTSASPKLTAPLLDTPKSITIIPQEVMQERGTTSLLDVLRTTPGITLGAGEGGTPMGDRPFIRGYEASTDMMIDGVRDLGRFSHEAFNIEQVEVIKGPGSAYSGRGSTGGSINMVSKKPRADNAFSASLGLGAADYKRATADANWRISESLALRLNAMNHQGKTPGRDLKKGDRWGLAPSLTLGVGSATQATLSYYALRAEDMPDQGHPMDTGLPDARGEPVRVRRDNFYGVWGRDKRRNESDIATLEVSHTFANNWHLRNVLRDGESINKYIFSRPSIHADTGLVNRDVRASNRKSEVFANQTDLQGRFDLAGMANEFVIGFEYSKEELRTAATPPNADFAVPRTDLHNPTPWDRYNGPRLSDFSNDYSTLSNRTHARGLYAFDTIHITEQWLANVGIRYDDYEITDGTRTNAVDFWNYQLGVVYKPAPNASVYVSFGTSSNPSGETQGQAGGADGPAGGTLAGGRENLDPEKNRSFEIGTKWDVLDNKMALTAAVFRTEKRNQRATDPVTGDIALIGSNRTTGFELGAAGSITPRWTLFAGYTYLNPKMIDDGAGSNDGKRLKFIAKSSLSAWSTYRVTDRFTLGGGANYMSQRWMNDANTIGVPAYWRFDAMATYRINSQLDFRLNVLNIGDKTIYEGSHVGIFANVGPGRTAMLTANYRF